MDEHSETIEQDKGERGKKISTLSFAAGAIKMRWATVTPKTKHSHLISSFRTSYRGAYVQCREAKHNHQTEG